MISLHVYLNPKDGKTADLESAIRDRWIAAMATQPGFISAAVLTPFSDEALGALGAIKPKTAYEVVSFWKSEELRLEWVARPIHDEVFAPLLELAAEVSFTLNDVPDEWNIR
ncbi:MAG: antibiotic biosynthesis monooxygenase [Chloroflexi bacterium]|nr:antibiotic biosynthesis monooxygenase [Chloroflexota bacterium]